MPALIGLKLAMTSPIANKETGCLSSYSSAFTSKKEHSNQTLDLTLERPFFGGQRPKTKAWACTCWQSKQKSNVATSKDQRTSRTGPRWLSVFHWNVVSHRQWPFSKKKESSPFRRSINRNTQFATTSSRPLTLSFTLGTALGWIALRNTHLLLVTAKETMKDRRKLGKSKYN